MHLSDALGSQVWRGGEWKDSREYLSGLILGRWSFSGAVLWFMNESSSCVLLLEEYGGRTMTVGYIKALMYFG